MDNSLTVISNELKLTMMVLAGLAIVFGFRRQGLKVYRNIIIMAFVSPFLVSFITSFFKLLPMWIVIPGLLIIAGALFKKVVGEEVWGQFFGAILYDVLWALPLKMIAAVGRCIASIFTRRP